MKSFVIKIQLLLTSERLIKQNFTHSTISKITSHTKIGLVFSYIKSLFELIIPNNINNGITLLYCNRKKMIKITKIIYTFFLMFYEPSSKYKRNFSFENTNKEIWQKQNLHITLTSTFSKKRNHRVELLLPTIKRKKK